MIIYFSCGEIESLLCSGFQRCREGTGLLLADIKSDFREDRDREVFFWGDDSLIFLAKAGMDQELKVKGGAEVCRPMQGKMGSRKR